MIPLIEPTLGFDEVADDIRKIIESGRLTGGPYVERFEREIADFVGTKHALATTSATTALHLSLAAAGIGPGDEVLVSDFTFPASGNAIVQTGAVPVMVDSVAGGFDLDVDDAARKLTPATKAIMPIDPFGLSADMKGISALAEAHGLTVVEDAACALGAHRDGRMCGSWPGTGCFSFHPRKPITTGEGGMVTTDDDELAALMRVLRSHGATHGSAGVEFTEFGYNYRMSEIQAAMGLAQFRRFDEILGERRRIAGIYFDLLDGVNGLTLPLRERAEGCTFQSFVVMLDPSVDRDAVIAGLREAGIEATLGTYAMHSHPVFAKFGYRPGDLANSWRAQNDSLTLPLIHGMDRETVERIVATAVELIGERRRPC